MEDVLLPVWEFLTERWVEVLGFVVGLVYLWWEYHADARMWIASVVMPAISLKVYYSAGLYADFAINIYYLLIAVYGWWQWTGRGRVHGGKEKREVHITRFPLRVVPVYALALAALWVVLWWLLGFTNSTVPVADSFTTALSIVAMVMLARKYAEQWLAWFVVDAVCTALYVYKGIYFYSLLYAIYTVISLIGYRKWRKGILMN